MATVRMKENVQLNDHMLRTEKLVFACSLTPASVAEGQLATCDVPSVALLRVAGHTATVDAIEVLPWTPPTATTFGLYLKIGTTVTPSLGPVPTMEDYADAVYSALVFDDTSTSAPATNTNASGPGAVYGVNCWLTPLGNIAMEITTTESNTSTPIDLVVNVDYREEVK